MKSLVTILGCGNSTGIPAIGNYWGKCDPAEPKNRRLRSSILVRSGNTAIVVDTGPDFREQLNRANIETVDAALYSHAHGDHVHGIDDLRPIRHRRGALVPVYGNRATLEELQSRFHYMFAGGNHALYPPVLEAKPFKTADFGAEQVIGELRFVPFEQDHGTCVSIGYRFGDIAYSPDFVRLDDKAVEILRGVRIWIADCAAYKDTQNAVHANLETIFSLREKIGAHEVYLTSLSLAMDYRALEKELRNGVKPAFDGLSLS
jgi:phosphoribosyl 1,2-cyclic phosphate phosphodiesterase